MAEALKEDLAQSKEILEIAARDTSGKADLAPLISLFQRTSDVLSVIGLQTPGEILANIRNDIESWADRSEYTQDNLQEVADGLLYVESTLESLSRGDLNFTADSEQTKRALMAKNQLDEAEIIVIREAQAGIAESKDQIAAFIEYNYDVVHIQKVIETLVTVRGGVQILQLNRAADVLVSCEQFFQSVVDKGIDENEIQTVLETMADALIALEYYLSEIELHGVAPPNVLDIAEQSLSANR